MPCSSEMDISKNTFGFAIFLTTCALFVIADYRNSLRICKIECKVTPLGRQRIVNETCTIKALSRYRTAINIHAFLLEPFQDVLINMQIFKKNSVTYLPYLVNVTVDICKFLGGESVGAAGFYTRFMIGWVNKYSNINHSCPYLGDLWFKNLEPFADKIPVFAPIGDYRLDLRFYQSSLKNLLVTVRGYGTIKLKPYME